MKKWIILLFYVALIGNLAIILFFWFKGSSVYLIKAWPGSYEIAFGRLFGLLGQYFFLLEIVLIGRIRPFERIMGYDKMNRWHRMIGVFALLLIAVHPVLLSIGYAKDGDVSIFVQLKSFIFDWDDVAKAAFAFGLLLFAIAISYRKIRYRMSYEKWYIVHLLLYLVIGLAFGHQIQTGNMSRGGALYYWLILNFLIFGWVLFYRFITPFLINHKHKFKVSRNVTETADVVSLYIEGERLDEFKFQAGQYALVNFIKKGSWHTHPFSFSSVYNGKSLRFSIKMLGNFTNSIKEIRSGTRVYLDGPFGVFTRAAAKNEKILLIAGGIGITPLRALAEEFAKKNMDVILLYANKKFESIVFLDEFAELMKNFSNFKVHYVLEDPCFGYASGRIDLNVIKRFVPDFLCRDLYLCGPSAMIESLIKPLKSAGISKEQLHYELFSF